MRKKSIGLGAGGMENVSVASRGDTIGMSSSGTSASPVSASRTTTSPAFSIAAQGTHSSPAVPIRRLRLKGRQSALSLYGSADAAQSVTLPCVATGGGFSGAHASFDPTSHREVLRVNGVCAMRKVLRLETNAEHPNTNGPLYAAG